MNGGTQKKAIIIGASEEALHTIEKAHENGLFVTALDGNPAASGLAAADKALVVDISDERATIEAARKEDPDFVLTVPIGRYLTTIGMINDTLQLPGISREMAEKCTDKWLFHETLVQKGLRNCYCYPASEIKEKRDTGSVAFGEEIPEDKLTFPAILKPRFGSGSRGIHMLFSKEDLERGLSEIGEEDYILEECIAGEEYGIDGAVIGGKFHLILLRKKKNTPFPARQAVAYFSVLPEDPFYGQAREYMEAVIEAMELDECLLHADLIQGENGPFVIELSARPSGHNLHNLFTPLCTGIDEAEEYIRYRMGRSYSFAPKETKDMMIHYFDMEGKVDRIPDRTEMEQILQQEDADILLQEYVCHIHKGDVLQPVSDGHSVMGRGYFILENRGGAVKENIWKETEEGMQEEKFLRAAEIMKSAFF